jgi:phosphate transport system substrate-binding protein
MRRNKIGFQIVALLSVSLFLAVSCGAPESGDIDTITKGEIYISVDESLKDVVSTGIYNFQQINPEAKITALYLPQEHAYKALLSDSIRLVIGGRGLNEQELKNFEARKVTPRSTPLAKDAVALIVGRNYVDSISLSTLESWMKGNGAENSELVLVFDNSASGAVSYLMERFELKELPKQVYALNNNEEVVKYVSENKNAVGILANNWITQLGAADKAAIDAKIKYLAVSGADTRKGYFFPEQTFIADSTYPLIRSIYGISNESRVGLGTGFLSFLASERGQRIILKAGLLPNDMPGRELIIHD